MIEIRELDYQNEAIWGNETELKEGLIPVTNKILRANRQERYPEVILKAITGSGKTVIMAKYIQEMYKQENRPSLVFIWLSIGAGGLQFQSAGKIAPLLANSNISIICPKTEAEFNEGEFIDKTLLVLNWEKLNNTKDEQLVSNLMQGEKHNLKQAVLNTSDDVKFIVLIDEFHRNYNTTAYKLIMDLFKPSVIIGMTATPTDEQLKNKYCLINIPTDKVREVGMIKQGTLFNDGIEEVNLEKELEFGLEEAILKVAIHKRQFLEEQMRKENSAVIPLCLIQIPNGRNDFKERIINFLEKQIDNGETIKENIDYVCWMSDSPKNIEIIQNMDSNSIKYLIFKQAVATGWDCPRAHILVKFRTVKEKLEAFDLQTIGRILRTPERKRYKKCDELNYGYIYAAEDKFDYSKEVEKALGNPEARNRKIRFETDTIELEKVLKTDIIESFTAKEIDAIKVFSEKLEEKYNISKADNSFEKIDIFEGKLEIDDKLLDTEGKKVDIADGDNTSIKLNNVQLDRKFSELLIKFERNYISSSDIKAVSLRFFKEKSDANSETGVIELIRRFLMYREAIYKALLETGEILNQSKKRKKTGEVAYHFPRSIKYLVENKNNMYRKDLYKPGVINMFTEPEHIFIQELEKNENVKWWYKNLNHGREALCVTYVESEERKSGKVSQSIAPTFPDFVVLFESKGIQSVGIYEIKDVDKVENINDRKSDAIKSRIIRYYQENTSDIKNFYGGVVKIKNFHQYDEEEEIYLGEIQNLNDFRELIVK